MVHTLFDNASGNPTKMSQNSPFQSYLMHTLIRGEETMPISLSSLFFTRLSQSTYSPYRQKNRKSMMGKKGRKKRKGRNGFRRCDVIRSHPEPKSIECIAKTASISHHDFPKIMNVTNGQFPIFSLLYNQYSPACINNY